MSDYSLILIDPRATAWRVSSLSPVTERGGVIKLSLLMNQNWSVSINIWSAEKSPVFLLICLLFIFNAHKAKNFGRDSWNVADILLLDDKL